MRRLLSWNNNGTRILLASVLVIGLGVGGVFLVQHWLRTPASPDLVVDPGKPSTREAIPVPEVRFTDITESSGIRFHHVNGFSGSRLLPETMGGGCAFLDYDGDGRQDLLFVNSCYWPGRDTDKKPPTLELYRGLGDCTFENVTQAAGLAVTLYGMGVTVGDYDNDGSPDLFISGVGGNRLFHNVNDGSGKHHFVDVTKTAGVGGPGGWPADLTWKELLEYGRPIPFPSSCAFLDYDGDSLLDLFVCSYVTWSPAADLAIASTREGAERSFVQPDQFEGAKCVLYRNLGGGKFEDASESAGIQVVEPEAASEGARLRSVGKSLGVIVCDPDEDGWPDIVVANDTVRNFFFRNVAASGDRRRFEEVGLLSGVAYVQGKARGGMGIDWGEYRPGRSALVIANFSNEPTSFLGLDPASRSRRLRFSDAALSVGIFGPSRPPLKFGTFFFDYDLDGRLDLLTCNGHLEPEIALMQKSQTYAQPPTLFWNTGGEVRCFEPVTPTQAGQDLFKPIVGRGSAFADIDGDGDLDVVLVANNGPARLLRNDNKLGHHWLRLHLQGDGAHTSRSAFGARVAVEADGKVQVREVKSARGYLSQSELVLTFGLGKASKVDRITIRWPQRASQTPQVLEDIEVDQTLEIQQEPGEK